MAKAATYNAGGERTGAMDLPDGLFGAAPNGHVVWEAVVNFRANQRLGTVRTKTRAEIARSNSKPWRQKGTGRARAGTFRSPLWVGGGIIHGPKPRDHRYKLPRKVKRLALRTALADRARADRVVVIDAFELREIKTKLVQQLLNRMELGNEKVLLLVKELTDRIALSTRNIPNVVAMPAREVNTYTVVAADRIVITREALAQLEEVFT